MQKISSNSLSHLLLSLALGLACITSALAGVKTATPPAGMLLQQADSLALAGDSAAALALLDRALALDPKHWPALILRGKLELAEGRLDQAREDFKRVLFSDSPRMRAQAHVGLGDRFFRITNQVMRAEAEYRLAVSIDPQCKEGWYGMVRAGMGLRDTQGYHATDDAAKSLLLLDPEYKDVYSIWRDVLRNQSDSQIREVDSSLDGYIADHPGRIGWLVDLARDCYHLNEIDSALQKLDRLEQADSTERAAERLLVAARCRLEQGDTLGFEDCYFRGLQEAERAGDFTAFIREAEPIFTPEEVERVRKLSSAAEWGAFFRAFWKRRDPDPLTPHNERLIVHYRRLAQAETSYYLHNPHSLFQNSSEYFTMLFPFVPVSGDYGYDATKTFWNRSRSLALDQRGLLFIRHGEPLHVKGPLNDWDYKPATFMPAQEALYTMNYLNKTFKEDNYYEVWEYKKALFVFQQKSGTGEYVYFPLAISGSGLGDMNKAMQTETFEDPLPAFRQDSYGADFLGPGGRLEVEFYQSAPLSAAPGDTGPAADASLFDSTWGSPSVNSAASQLVSLDGDTLWLAVNRLFAEPGLHYYALRMDIPGHRAVVRKPINLRAYEQDSLQLSGVILGSPPLSGQPSYRRRGVAILPRPSLSFRSGEKIAVYFEIYGLEKDPQEARSFKEAVTVSLVKEKIGMVEGALEGLKWWKDRRSTDLTLAFDRQVTRPDGPVPEYFTVDTRYLAPGEYRLVIEILDRAAGAKKRTGCFFELREND